MSEPKKKILRKTAAGSVAVLPKVGQHIEQAVYIIRGHRVMLDADLAALYRVETFRLNEAVKRNIGRFPEDFMFQLNEKEALASRSQFVTLNVENKENHKDTRSRSQIAILNEEGSENQRDTASRFQNGILKKGRGHNLKYLPYAFTEQGIAMLSSVLRSERAVAVNIEIMRAFVKMRKLVNSQAIIKRDIDVLKHQFKDHDQQIKAIFMMIDDIVMRPVEAPKKRKIGFLRDNEDR